MSSTFLDQIVLTTNLRRTYPELLETPMMTRSYGFIVLLHR